MRERNRGTYSAVAKLDNYATTKVAPYPYAFQSTTWGLMIGGNEIMFDNVIPGFAARRTKGEVFFNSLDHTIRKQEVVSEGTLELRSKGPWANNPTRYTTWKYVGSWAACHVPFIVDKWGNKLFEPPELIESNELLDLQSQVAAEVMRTRGMNQGNLFESIAQYQQLLALVPGILQNARKIFLRTNRGNTLNQFLINEWRTTRSYASAYLLYRYGLKPLVMDIMLVVNGIKKGIGQKRVTTRAQASLLRDDDNFIIATSAGDLQYEIAASCIDDLLVRGMSLDDTMVTVADNLGLSAKALLTTPWELLTRSFVLDWFINAGDFFAALIPAFGYRNLGSALVEKRTRTALIRSQNFSVAGSATWGAVLGVPSDVFRVTVTTKKRTPLPTPKLVVRNDFGFAKLTRLADAIALLRQLRV